MADVFVSYSRKDKEFAQILHDALENSQQNTWVDWKDILPTAEWWHEIERAIEGADTFLFVISPDSIISEYCGKEIEHADRLNKRILPIVRRDVIGSEGDIHPALSRHQWIFFRESDDFDIAFQRLIAAIAIDIAHIHAHTRLLVRAIEWNDKGRKDGFLLRGEDLQDGEIWLEKGVVKDPQPTELQGTYIKISREIEDATHRAVERQKIELSMNNSELLWRDNHQLESLIALIKAGKRLQETKFAPDNEMLLRFKLHQNLYQRIHEKNRLHGHRGDILSIAFSPDGQTIASASRDETVRLWNLEGKELLTFRGHNLKGFQAQVNCVAFSPDSKTIASASTDQTVKLWNLEGIEIFTFNGNSHLDTVWSIAFSSDSKTLLLAMTNNTVKLISLQGEILHTFVGHENAVISVAFSPDYRTFASASLDRTVKLWSIEGDELITLRGHSDTVTSVTFSPDGQIIASASADQTVKLWNLQGVELLTFTGHNSEVSSVVFSPNGQIIVSGSDDNTVKIWSIRGRELDTFIGHSVQVANSYGRHNVPMSVAISSDGKTIASVSNDVSNNGADGSIKLWKIYYELPLLKIYGELPLTFVNHKSRVFNVTFAPDGKKIASASADKTVKLWDLLGNELLTLIGHSSCIFDVAFSPDGKIIASASADKTVKLWDLLGNELLTLIGHDEAVTSIAFSPNGIIASASADKTVKLWDSLGNELLTFRGHSAEVDSIAFSPDGQTIASAGIDKSIKLWNLQGIEIRTFTGHTGQVWRIAFSPDGQTIVSAGILDNVKLWNLQGLELKTFPVCSTGVSFSPDNKLIALSTRDIELWSLQGEKLYTFLYGSFNGIWGVAFAPDGLSIALAGGDNTIKLYDIGLDSLVEKGFNWLKDYLINNPNATDEDRQMCGIPPRQK